VAVHISAYIRFICGPRTLGTSVRLPASTLPSCACRARRTSIGRLFAGWRGRSHPSRHARTRAGSNAMRIMNRCEWRSLVPRRARKLKRRLGRPSGRECSVKSHRSVNTCEEIGTMLSTLAMLSMKARRTGRLDHSTIAPSDDSREHRIIESSAT